MPYIPCKSKLFGGGPPCPRTTSATLTLGNKSSTYRWCISNSISFLLAISITYLLEKNSGTHRWWMSISITFLLAISITYLLKKKFKYPSMMDVNFNYISSEEKKSSTLTLGRVWVLHIIINMSWPEPPRTKQATLVFEKEMQTSSSSRTITPMYHISMRYF